MITKKLQVSINDENRIEFEPSNRKHRYNYKRINRKNFIKTLNKAIMKKVPNIKNLKIQEINEYL